VSNVWFCSDLHFGHKNIEKFRIFIVDEQDNRETIKAHWNDRVSKRDTVYVLGDAAFTMDAVQDFGTLPGQKVLVRGNHDTLDTQVYLKYFKSVEGLLKFKEFWLSHAPIHPDELRGKINLHGHVHYQSIRKSFNPMVDVKQELDNRYFNCCVENLRSVFQSSLVSLDQLRKHLAQP